MLYSNIFIYFRFESCSSDEEEPAYVPRSTLVDVIRKDDEFLLNRLRGVDTVQLPSGARQRTDRQISTGKVSPGQG